MFTKENEIFYVCEVCGYVYNPLKNDPPFDNLPADWVCPICGAEKKIFHRKSLYGADSQSEISEAQKIPKLDPSKYVYLCAVCSYVYAPAKNEPLFEDLPSDWVCPVCGVEKKIFQRKSLDGADDQSETSEAQKIPKLDPSKYVYLCAVCGYVYAPSKNEPLFEDLPSDWVCPICGAEKKIFQVKAII